MKACRTKFKCLSSVLTSDCHVNVMYHLAMHGKWQTDLGPACGKIVPMFARRVIVIRQIKILKTRICRSLFFHHWCSFAIDLIVTFLDLRNIDKSRFNQASDLVPHQMSPCFPLSSWNFYELRLNSKLSNREK